jgi:hypothetical protein
LTDVVERHPIEVLTRVDLVVRGGRLVSPSGIISAGLAVRGGIIVAISHEDALPEAREAIDATGSTSFPVSSTRTSTFDPRDTSTLEGPPGWGQMVTRQGGGRPR